MGGLLISSVKDQFLKVGTVLYVVYFSQNVFARLLLLELG